jgi:hypothetical protein
MCRSSLPPPAARLSDLADQNRRKKPAALFRLLESRLTGRTYLAIVIAQSSN